MLTAYMPSRKRDNGNESCNETSSVYQNVDGIFHSTKQTHIKMDKFNGKLPLAGLMNLQRGTKNIVEYAFDSLLLATSNSC